MKSVLYDAVPELKESFRHLLPRHQVPDEAATGGLLPRQYLNVIMSP
jgi:hypothetical protein